MKNYNLSMRHIFLILSFLFVISCDDVLEEDPKGLLSSDSFWNNEVNAIGAVNAVYTRPMEMPP
ncbi:MAG: hypothetical protein AB3N10_21665, partial [Allomuricauda sp.]